jgi:hypothetical protein
MHRLPSHSRFRFLVNTHEFTIERGEGYLDLDFGGEVDASFAPMPGGSISISAVHPHIRIMWAQGAASRPGPGYPIFTHSW